MPTRDRLELEPLERLMYGAVLLTVALAVAPAAVVAGPLAVAIDHRGWRRWPALATGLLLGCLVGWAGGWDAPLRAWSSLATCLVRAGPVRWPDLGWVAAGGAALGCVAAPILQALIHHRDEHEATRRRRTLSDRRRAEVQARRIAARGHRPEPTGRTLLGPRLAGRMPTCTIRHRASAVVAVPLSEWTRQALVVGETGSGKTLTALTLAAETMRAGWDVYWIDGKADPEIAARFLATALSAGVAAADGSRDPIDGWRGSPESVINRLLATQVFTEPYYAGIARNVLKWSVVGETPQTFRELVARMDKRDLRRAWRDTPEEAEKIRRIPDADFLGARYRYEGVAWAVGTALDGAWSYEDVRAAYVPVGRPEHRDQAEEIGAFILEDLLHWAMARKPPHRQALVVVDEFSKLAARPDAAVELVERVRSFNVGVVLIGQTWASLGRSETVRERLAGTVGTIVVHQLKQPERIVELAGTEWTMERTEQTTGLGQTGRATQRVAHRYLVDPDEVRRLRCGEAFLIRAGEAVKLQVRAPTAFAARRS